MGKILVIADIEDKCFATPRGLELAFRLGHAVDVVAFCYTSLKALKLTTTEQAEIRERLVAQREESVQKRIDKWSHPEQKVQLKVVWGKEIHAWVNKQCAGDKYLAVVKTGNRSESMIHTPTDWQLLRECPAPVFLVAEKKWHRTKPILAALDLSTTLAQKKKLNHKVLGAAKLLAATLDVELKIICGIQIPTLLSDLDLIDPVAYEKEARESMQPQIRKLAAAHELPETAFRCKRGPAEKVITSRAAKVRAQVVVMGTVGRTGVKARLMGNTAEKVLQHMKTDVLAIKP